MNSVKILLSDLKDSKLLMTFLIFVGALSSAFKAGTIGFVKIMGDLIFPSATVEAEINSAVEEEGSSYLFQFLEKIYELTEVEPVFSAIFLIGLLITLSGVARYIFASNIRYLAEFKSVSMRERLMSHYLKLDARFKSAINEGSGGLISRILNDVQIYQQGVTRLSDLVKEPFLVLFAAGWLFLLNWKVTLFLFVGFPPIFYVIKRISKSLRKHSKSSQETMEGLTMTLKEGLDGSRVVHSFNLQEQIEARFKKQTRSYFAIIRKIISREELSGPLMESISTIVFCATLVLMYFMAQDEALSSGDFFAILAAIGFLSDSARKTQGAFIRIQQASTAKTRINDLLSSAQKSTVGEPVKDKKFPEKLSIIEFEDVTVNIGEKRILDRINLSIKSGQTVAMVGSSGSGKTTLLNLLDLYIKPSSGSVKFDGIDSQTISSESLRSNIALVSQDPFLFNLSVFENLKLAKPDLTEEEALKALALANADFVLDRQDSIHSLAGERGSGFSGGERQRISIARALIKNAPILLLDEATSALDTQSEKEVQKGLDSLKKGRTCFVVAHRISTIVDSDLILVFKEGEVIQSGTHKELIDKKGLYAELCEMQYLI